MITGSSPLTQAIVADVVRDYDLFVELLGNALSNDGFLEVPSTEGRANLTFVTGSGRRFTFRASLDEVFDAVEKLDGEILSDAEDCSPLLGQLRLFSVHVEEAVELASEDAVHLELRSSGVVAT